MTLRKIAITVIGGFLLLIGLVFILLPGPAVIFIPAGLALLSLEYKGAKTWLRKSQRAFKLTAEKSDRFISNLRSKQFKRGS